MTDNNSDPAGRRQEILENARETIGGSMGDLWWTFLVRGILASIVCIAALFWPTASVALLLRLVGLFLLVDGAITFLGFRNRAGSGSGNLFAIASAAVGALLLLMPGTSARIAFLLIGLWALITGVTYLWQWRQMPDELDERSMTRNAGIIACAAGIVLVFWPGTGLVAIGWVIAIAAFVVALVSFLIAMRFKRVHDRMDMKVID